MQVTSSPPPPATSWLSRTFGPLENPVFRPIWLAGTASNLGNMIQITAAAWLMTVLTTSPLLVALVQSAAMLPVVFVALFAGAAADIFDKRHLILIGNVISIGAVLALFALTQMDLVTPLSLLLLTGLVGVGAAIVGPAWQASVSEIVDRDQLMPAISLNNLSFNVARCVGPAIGAEVVVLAGAAFAFLSNAGTYLMLIGALLHWRRTADISPLPRETIGRAAGDGLRFVLLSPALVTLLIRAFFLAFCAAAALSMPPLVALALDSGPRGLGILLAGFGGGAMIGSLTAATMRERLSTDQLVFANSLLLALALLAVGLSRNIWLSMLALVFGGIGWVQSVAVLQVAIQTSCPRWVTARTISIFGVIFSLGIAGGAAVWGAIAGASGVFTAMMCAAGALFTTAFAARLMPFQQPSYEELQPSEVQIPMASAQIHPRSGPISISIEYRVPRENMAAFRNAMIELQRVRRRDGARSWSLAQDIEDHELWLERFLSPTWADYQHRISRRLAGDEPIHEKVRALCVGPINWHRRLERSPRALPLDSGKNADIDQRPAAIDDVV